jgi:hypothetical protein
MTRLKYLIKKILASLGLYHPSLKIKISSERKGAIILEHQKPGVRVFVETGTYRGDMIDRVGNRFEKIYSIELDEDLYDKAKQRFENRKNINLLQGDSAVEIKKILELLKEPALFWLDAHAPGKITAQNSPTIGELASILSHSVKDHTILIDDARMFDRKTIRLVKNMAKNNGYKFAIKNGIFMLL